MPAVAPSPHRLCRWMLSLLALCALCAVGMCQDCDFVESATTNAEGSTGSAASAGTAEACKTACGSGCLAVLFEPSSITKCKTFTSAPRNVVSSSTHSGKTFYRKSCTSDCTFTAETNTNADGGEIKMSATTADSCKALCNKGCVAVISDPTAGITCRVFDAEPTNVAQNNRYTNTLIRRNCPGGNTGNTCTMTSVADNTVTSAPSVSVDLTVSADRCKRLCTRVTQCTAVSVNDSTCILHTSPATTAPATGYIHAGKTKCMNGTDCCFENEQQNRKGTSSTNKLVEAKADSCKALCGEIRACVAAAFSGSTCHLFTSTPTVSTQAGLSYFSKSCPGSNSGSLTIYSSCENSGVEVTPLSTLIGVGFAMLIVCLP